MDEGRRPSSHSSRGPGETSLTGSWLPDATFELWHSTPVKKNNDGGPVDAGQSEMHRTAGQSARSGQAFFPTAALGLHGLQTGPGGVECSTILRQRRELQLLVAELKDRDRELNTAAASHHKQLLAWEQDRQRVLTLEQRHARLDDELQKRSEVIRLLSKRLQVVETREKLVQQQLSEAQQLLHNLDQNQQHVSQQCQDFEDKNQSLTSTVMALSSQVGSLQVREEELSSMLKLKDMDVTEATAHIIDLTARLRALETSQKESRVRESKQLADLEENRRRYREARRENARLKEELQVQVSQSSAQREEVIRLKQEGQLLRRDLALTGEGESWKDELLMLGRSKQERSEAELHCLRQVCENQQNDLQLLQLNLDSAREAAKEKRGRSSFGSQGDLTCGCLDDPPSSSLWMKSPMPVREPLLTTNQRDVTSLLTTNQRDVTYLLTTNQRDVTSLLTTNQRDVVSGDLGFFSAASKDRLLDESRQMVASLERPAPRGPAPSRRCNSVGGLGAGQDDRDAEESPSVSPRCVHACVHARQSSPRPRPSPTRQDSETPPKACPLHRT